jgi:hypothetical protein
MKPVLFLLIFFLMPATFLLSTPADSWSGNWGAISYSDSTGRWGTSYDYRRESIAINAAVESCGVEDCKAVIWFRNSCGALAKGNGGKGWASHPRKHVAQNRAIAECRKRASGCRVIAWSCTTR